MSIMVTEIYDALIEAGASEQKARAAAQSVPLAEQLTTKQDIAVLKTDITELRTEMHKTALVTTSLTVGLVVTLLKLLP